MKIKTAIILILAILSKVFCLGQSSIDRYDSLSQWNTDTAVLNQILEQHFHGGEENFLKTLAQNIKYPQAANRNFKEGTVLIKLSIIDTFQQVEILNKIGSEFDKEIVTVFNRIQKQWKSDKKIEMNISVKFSINPEKETKYHDDATVQIISYHIGDDTCNSSTTEYLTEMAEYSIEYEDYESAIIYLKELINRFPFNKEYQKLYENTWKKIKE